MMGMSVAALAELDAQAQDDTDAAMEAYAEEFERHDADGSGTISPDELRLVMESLGEDMTEEDFQKLLVEVDKDGDGEVDYEEFACGLIAETKEERKSFHEEATSAVKTKAQAAMPVKRVPSGPRQVKEVIAPVQEFVAPPPANPITSKRGSGGNGGSSQFDLCTVPTPCAPPPVHPPTHAATAQSSRRHKSRQATSSERSV
jgi:hypothetical protein